MSPSQGHYYYHVGEKAGQPLRSDQMTGARPSPLKINKGSHLIEKSSSSSSSSSSSCREPTQQQRHPVIIYTQSPKVIHTQARDFMALVQKLTGLSRPDDPSSAAPPPECSGSDDGTSSSVVTEENNGGGGGAVTQASSSSGSVAAPPAFNGQQLANPFFSDVPLFAPSASELSCSAQPFYIFQDSVLPTPNLGSSISPTIMENIKAYGEY